MHRATVTSKGQITVPADIREALGIGQGDGVVFELKAGYALFRRQPSIGEALAHIAEEPAHGSSAFASDAQALHEHFRVQEPEHRADDVAYLCGPGRCVRFNVGKGSGGGE